MDSDVVEVVARFGGTILDVTHVGPTETYRIGTAPGTNLQVPGLTCFPLVSGRTVRIPVGIPSVERDGWTELRVGALGIYITRTKLARAPLARPRVERRAPLFIAASLIAHLALWLVALTFAPFERLPGKQIPRLRYTHLGAPRPEVVTKLSPVVVPKQAAGVAQPQRSSRVPRAAGEDSRGLTPEQAVARVAKAFDKIDVAKQLGDLKAENQYVEADMYEQGFGGGARFDPSNREGFESVAVGGYMTMSYDVKLCPNKTCTVDGPIPALYVRTHLHAHLDEIYACYAEYAEGPGTITLSFTITPDGAVRDAHGSGLGETGPCAARVVGEIFFKALGNDFHPPRETRVRYPLRFQPSRG